MKIITNQKIINFIELEKFVLDHPYGNFFQSTKAFHFFKSVENYDPILIVALDRAKVVGSLLAVITKEGKGLRGYFSRRLIVWGGPLVKDDRSDIWSELLKKLDELISRRTIYAEFRNFRDLSIKKKIFEKERYQFNEHLNYIVSISTLQEAKDRLSKSKKRQINKSFKSGAEFFLPDKLEHIESFYTILHRLYIDKIKKPLPPFSFFSKFFKDPSLGRYLLIKYNAEIIGGIMCPVYKNTIYEWFVCGKDNEIPDVYPSVLATWSAIQYAAYTGISNFDFMGAGRPDVVYGVREFKSKFGGEMVNFGRFVRINQKLHYQIGKLGLEILKKVS